MEQYYLWMLLACIAVLAISMLTGVWYYFKWRRLRKEYKDIVKELDSFNDTGYHEDDPADASADRSNPGSHNTPE